MKYFDAYKLVWVVSLFVVGGVIFLLARYVLQQAQLKGMTNALWQNYKSHIWEASSGRTINVQDGTVTTSEGQGYTLLRAVWENDPATFATTWRWTAANLQRSDKLFSWRWGERPDGTYGILIAQNGQNTASDADTDIAFALLMAGHEWHQSGYTVAAQEIIPHIWQQEVVSIHGHYYLAADNIEKTAATSYIVVNPSYLEPYAYRTFAREDSSDPWQQLVPDSYNLIQHATTASLDMETSAGLPPDWVGVDRVSGALQAVDVAHTTDFSYDAFRVLWRVSLDWQWYKDPRAKHALDTFGGVQSLWDADHRWYNVSSQWKRRGVV